MVKFDIDPHRKHCLLEGLDDIGLTMVKAPKIAEFESKIAAGASLDLTRHGFLPFFRRENHVRAPGMKP